MGIAVVVVAFVAPFLVDLARQWWRDRQRARQRAGGVEVHRARAWPGRDRELARPGQLLLRADEMWWYDPVTPRGVRLTDVTVVDVDERPRGLVDRFRDGPPMVIEAVACDSALSIESPWTSDVALVLAQRQANDAPPAESTGVPAPDHVYAVQGLPWWGWAVPAVGALLIGGFLLLSALGLHTTGTVIASTDDGISTVTWTDPTTGAQHQDAVDSSGSETDEFAPDAVGDAVPIVVWPAPLNGLAWNEASTHTGLSLAGIALGITVLASWAVVAVRRRAAARARSLPPLVGTVPARSFGADEGDAALDVDRGSGSEFRGSPSTWTPITARLAKRAAVEDWDGEPGSWPTRGRLLRRAFLAAIVPLAFALGTAVFFLDAAQGAILLNTGPTTTQQTTVVGVDDGVPLLGSCWLESADPAGFDLSAPCSGLHQGDQVTVQVLTSTHTTVLGTSPARIVEPGGHDTTQRSIVLLALAVMISLGVLLSGLVSRLRPLQAQQRAVKQSRDQSCELRYARVRHIGDEMLLLFPLSGEVAPRWAVDLAGPLPAEVPLAGHVRIAGPLQAGGWAPEADTWSVPIIARRPIWGVSRLHQLQPDEVNELLRGPGEVLTELANEDLQP